ncbi:glycosyl transferase group 1 [Methanobacterium lacus]|uniref:Glycosyl transferase group 1 n=1 Tax=Methanobacterium lacus (strain AL-21) TaxID=877455 RepID=F0T7J1_METLA|nr:glycosyltransferase family 4 protein [Methanobacterium lacus]ADZ09559.1 glycosyl transferase group 1 [Methanobacterium lacus]
MKIAFIYDAAYPWVKGGAERRIYELSTRLVKQGHEVHWYSLAWWREERKLMDIEMDGIKLHGVSKPKPLYTEDRRSIKEAIFFSLHLINPIMKEKFDVVDCQGFPFFSSFVCKFHQAIGRSKMVITLHEVWGDYWYEYLGRAGIFGKLVERSMLALTDRFITVSQKTERDLQAIKRTDKSHVVPNGIDLNQITNVKPAETGFELLFAGRLIKEKKVDLLLRSLPKVLKTCPDIKCMVVGDGPERSRLEGLCKELELTATVEFSGFMEGYNELISIMKSSEVLVLPSEREGFGMVVVEANACGTPVVVVDYPMNAAKDLVQEGRNGYISKPDPEDLAQTIIKTLKNRKNMVETSRSMSKNYDWDRIVDELENVYLQTQKE